MSFSAMLCDWCDGVIFDHENFEIRDGCRVCPMCLNEEERKEDEEDEEAA
jgi:hypothetical protein|tara:strand:- start:220 stop:369 length:150 start_codon:yes stop_codon:yes gene_type:complete